MAQGRSTEIITMIKWIRTSRLSIKNSLSERGTPVPSCHREVVHRVSSSLLGPVDPRFRALSGRLQFTVRRHKFSLLAAVVLQHDASAAARWGLAGSLAQRRSNKIISMITWIWTGRLQIKKSLSLYLAAVVLQHDEAAAARARHLPLLGLNS